MWASYVATPSASVSTRTMVPPGTFEFAIAVTLASAEPVRSVSSLRWWPHGCELDAPGGADVLGADVLGAAVVVVDELDPDAAEATP
jgi:hypothetical protein